MSIIGFTGTQEGMTDRQKIKFRELLIVLGATEFHHGDCIGADDEAHKIAMDLKIPVAIHPPSNPAKRAFCKGAFKTYKPRPYLQRNGDIVDDSQVLVATPKTQTEERRSGTWATVRYARTAHKKRFVITP